MSLKRTYNSKFKRNAKFEKESDGSSEADTDSEIPDDQVEFNMPKPGPHAKVIPFFNPNKTNTHTHTLLNATSFFSPASGENGN